MQSVVKLLLKTSVLAENININTFLSINKIEKRYFFGIMGLEFFWIMLQQHDGLFAIDRNKGNWEN